MGAAADDGAVLEDDDQVGVADGGDALGDDHDRRVAGDRPQRRPQPGVGGEVERRERVVEQVDLGPSDRPPARSRAAGAGRRRGWCRPGRPPTASPSGIAATKSRACAISSASHICSSVASGRPCCRLLAMVPLKRNAFCGIRPSFDQSSSGSSSRTSTPSTSTRPLGHVEEPRHEVEQGRSCRRRWSR